MFHGRLELNADIEGKGLETIHEAQKYIDNECIKLMSPYTPFDSGILDKSARLNTVIGSGKINQVTPYARYLYYGKVYGPNIPIKENGQIVRFFSPPVKHNTGRDIQYNTAKHPQAGSHWFERMKADHKEKIRKGAQSIIDKG